MSEPESTTTETIPAAVDVAPADSEVAAPGVSLDELSKELGKSFPSKEAALKAIKDTFKGVSDMAHTRKTIKAVADRLGIDESSVIKRMEELQNQNPVPEPSPAPDNKVKELETRLDEVTFFSEHPDLKAHRALLSELRGASGKSFEEIAKSEVFSSTVEKLKAHDEAESKKSVLMSNPRLGQAKTKIDAARELAKSGDHSAAERAAVEAVLDAHLQ